MWKKAIGIGNIPDNTPFDFPIYDSKAFIIFNKFSKDNFIVYIDNKILDPSLYIKTDYGLELCSPLSELFPDFPDGHEYAIRIEYE